MHEVMKISFIKLRLEKDQSYFLSQISPKIVSRLLFPLGELYKNSVKEIVKDISILKDIATQKRVVNLFCGRENTDVLKNI